ncbi:MAG: hypothetical protein ACFFCO_05820 [Promethearchaeota archaeon]
MIERVTEGIYLIQPFPWIQIPYEIVMLIVIIITVGIFVVIGVMFAIGKGVEKALDYRTGRMIFGTILLLFSPFVADLNLFLPWGGVLFLALGVACIVEGIRWATPLYVGILWVISVGLYNLIMTSLTDNPEVIIFFAPFNVILCLLGWIHILIGLPLCIGMGAYTWHKKTRSEGIASPKYDSMLTPSLGN